jgi:sulfoquinovosidase
MRPLLASPLWLALALGVFPACNKGATDDPAPPAATPPPLSDGVEVTVSEAGSVLLSKGGRRLLATAASARPTARTFTESSKGLTGIWVFSREDEQATTFARVAGREAKGDSVEVRYEADLAGAPAGAASPAATLTVSPYKPGVSLVRLEASGVPTGKGGASLALPLACDADATFYGFGEQYNATEQRGEAFELFVSEQGIGRDPAKPPGGLNGDLHTTYFPMPYFLDARGWGALVKTSQRVLVDLCKGDPEVAWLEVTGGGPVELLVFHGPRPLDVIKQLGDELGRPKAPPPWAYDLWMVAQGGKDAVLAEAKAVEDAQLPVSVLWVQDWTGLRMNLDGGYGVQYRWAPDNELYPDLPGMIGGLKQRGYRVLGYANPFVVKGLDHFDAMDAQGLLIKKNGASYTHLAPNGVASHPDLTNPAAREYVKGYFRKMVLEVGLDGWMEDFGEWAPLDAEYADGGDPIARHNEYPVAWHSLSREVMDELRPDGDCMVFARSGFTGVQAHAQAFWVGDQEVSFRPYDGLPTVVPAMLNLGLAGMPFVTHDIAGFFGGPSTKELFQRWVELGAFTPFMRTHDGNKRDENWSWKKDAETTAHFRRFARVHKALAPDLIKLAAEAAQTGAPLVRHLMLAYPDDAASRRVHDQFLLGDALLVAPVVVEGQTRRAVYLPPGAWFHVWTGQRYEGGQSVDIDAPIGSPPVFSRDADRPELRAIE